MHEGLHFGEKVEMGLAIVVITTAAVVWWLNRNASPMERWKMLGRCGEADLEVAIDDRGRKRVCLCREWDDEGTMREQRFLLTTKRARELAGMLRLAAARGATVNVARWHLRHDKPGPPGTGP